MTRKIFFLTGIRSEYDILYPVIKAVDATPGMAASAIVVGAHLTPQFGHTVREIERDGVRIVAKIDSLLASDQLGGRMKGAGLQVLGLCDLFAMEKPDMLVVMGDREEVIVGAMTAAYHHIPVVHIGGGDHADDGNVDNLVRHATTKFSHLHMVASPRSAERVLKLGEEPWRVKTVGAPGLDRFLSTPQMDRATLFAELGIDWGEEPYVLVIQHPIIIDFEESRRNIRLTLDCLREFGVRAAIIHPNSDPGNFAIQQEIDTFVAGNPAARGFKNLPRLPFINLMRHAAAMVGNSSAGILEAPSLGLPTVNIGMRQRGREHAINVIFVDHDRDQILGALRKALTDQAFRAQVRDCVNPYGDGRAGERIATILSEVKIDAALMKKLITF